MAKNYLDDIIVGISTAVSNNAVSIIRLSGDGCIELVAKIFKGKDLNKVKSHTINYGFIYDEDSLIDEVLVSVFKAPKTYTKEDVVEINSHGGLYVTNKILSLCVKSGARLAEAGEFTKRAFLNGRIDLTKAEAVMDMIEAESDSALKLAGLALKGSIKNKIDEIREKLFKTISIISVNIDYPEYDDARELANDEVLPVVQEVKSDILDLLKHVKEATLLQNGINIAIVGKPNVGKSSLLNALAEENKAIVTEIPGTTRDKVEARINYGGYAFNFIDTAGIRETSDVVEKIGVDRSKEAIKTADFILMLFDSSTKMTEEEKELYDSIKNYPHLVVVNKKDIGKETYDFVNQTVISTFDQKDIDHLKDLIVEELGIKQIENKDIVYISSERQVEKLRSALNFLDEALINIQDGLFIDFIELNLRFAWNALGEITGDSSADELINELFKRFCLGK